MIAYAWQFLQFDVLPSYQSVVDAVRTVYWQLTANDGLGHEATSYGSQGMGPVDVNNFTPFSSLTPGEVQTWVEDAMGQDLYVLREDLDRRIAQQIDPPLETLTPPW